MDEQEKRAWFFKCTGKVATLERVWYLRFIEAAANERDECKRICRELAAQYSIDVFPEDGQSLDCKSARMARLTAENIEREITERST